MKKDMFENMGHFVGLSLAGYLQKRQPCYVLFRVVPASPFRFLG